MSSEKSSWPGVSSRLKTAPSYSNVITEVTTEMPRSRSIAIQSERVLRLSLLRLDLAGKLDRAAEQQELLGQRGLAGVGMGDDRKRAPAPDLALKLIATLWLAPRLAFLRRRDRCQSLVVHVLAHDAGEFCFKVDSLLRGLT